jgi:hypothetical protein
LDDLVDLGGFAVEVVGDRFLFEEWVIHFILIQGQYAKVRFIC